MKTFEGKNWVALSDEKIKDFPESHTHQHQNFVNQKGPELLRQFL